MSLMVTTALQTLVETADSVSTELMATPASAISHILEAIVRQRSMFAHLMFVRMEDSAFPILHLRDLSASVQLVLQVRS